MTHTEVETWIGENMSRKANEFGVGHFGITVRYERLEDDGCMVCTSHPEYERALIRVDSGSYASDTDAKQLEEDFEHDLMHVVHSPFEILRHQLQVVIEDVTQWNAVARIFNDCAEMTVCNMERMAKGIRRVTKEPSNVVDQGKVTV